MCGSLKRILRSVVDWGKDTYTESQTGPAQSVNQRPAQASVTVAGGITFLSQAGELPWHDTISSCIPRILRDKMKYGYKEYTWMLWECFCKEMR